MNSLDGLWVRIKVECTTSKNVGVGQSGGSMIFNDRVGKGFRVTVKSRNEADHRVLTKAVREQMQKMLGSPPAVMPFSFASGLIVANWEGTTSLLGQELLQDLCDSIQSTNVLNSSPRQPVPRQPVPRQEPERTGSANWSRPPGDNWMYSSLEDAKDIVKRFHAPFCGCDAESFFRTTTYNLYIQNDRQSVYAYISLTRGSSYFPIGVHPALSEETPYNQRALVVVLVHELLHALHQDWDHNRIIPQEKLLANKAGYYDALVELQRLAFNGKMRFQ